MKEIAMFLAFSWIGNSVMIGSAEYIRGSEPHGIAFFLVLVFINWRILRAVKKYTLSQEKAKDVNN